MATSRVVFSVVEFGSDLQKQCILLRDELLRKPLGLQFSAEELEKERNLFHVAGTLDSKLVACLVLQPSVKEHEMKMRQVAVATNYQNQQIGSKMIRFSELFAAERGFSTIYCHARVTALPFYTKLSWKVEGEQFEEVGIPHYRMLKSL
mmetsp:Transcript_24177/g.30761  ORF Transcript_24177/g.30761 Transcript_24177/m.30761 type:complete len:149 (-) Transcript_24177:217-663(-)